MLPNSSSLYLTKSLLDVTVSQCRSSAGDSPVWKSVCIHDRMYSSSLWFDDTPGNDLHTCESKLVGLLRRLPLWDDYHSTSLGSLCHIYIFPRMWLAFLFRLHPQSDTKLLLDHCHKNQLLFCVCLFYQHCSRFCILDTHQLNRKIKYCQQQTKQIENCL